MSDLPDQPVAEPEPAQAPATPAVRTAVRVPRRLVFRIPASALVGIVFLAMCASPVAMSGPWFTLVYVIPVVLAVWVLRTRTVVDTERLVARRVFTRTVLPWSAVASLRIADRKWVRAVRADGSEVVLPTVRTRHLPALALVSGGRLADPTERPA